MISKQVYKAPVWIWRDPSISPVIIKTDEVWLHWDLTYITQKHPATFDKEPRDSSLRPKIWLLIQAHFFLLRLQNCCYFCRTTCISVPPLVLPFRTPTGPLSFYILSLSCMSPVFLFWQHKVNKAGLTPSLKVLSSFKGTAASIFAFTRPLSYPFFNHKKRIITLSKWKDDIDGSLKGAMTSYICDGQLCYNVFWLLIHRLLQKSCWQRWRGPVLPSQTLIFPSSLFCCSFMDFILKQEWQPAAKTEPHGPQHMDSSMIPN